MKKIMVSKLPKTWLIDIDGVIFKHNSHLEKTGDVLNKYVKELFEQIAPIDVIIILTSRSNKHKKETLASLKKNGIRFDHILFNLPLGERIIVNDAKPKGLQTAIAINTKRDKLGQLQIIIDGKR